MTGDARVYALAAANDAKAAAYIVNFSGEPVELTCPLPPYFQDVLARLGPGIDTE